MFELYRPISQTTIVVICRDDEKRKIKEEAKKVGLSMNKYIRQKLGMTIDYKSCGVKKEIINDLFA